MAKEQSNVGDLLKNLNSINGINDYFLSNYDDGEEEDEDEDNEHGGGGDGDNDDEYGIYDSWCSSSDFENEEDDSDNQWKKKLLFDENFLLHFQQLYNFNCSEKDNKSINIYKQEMAAKNAQQLINEEEKEKRKAERKKAKKKRRREKKRQKQKAGSITESGEDKKVSENKSSKSSKSSPDRPCLSSEDMDDGEEFLDINSAFVSVAVSKKKKNVHVSTTGMEKTRPAPKKTQTSGDQIIAESERLAVIGYKLASKEQYEQAVEYFTKAIHLVHDDHRFFSNRSFCYCQLGHYAKALKDADRAIALAPNSPKGYYRRGEALKGLNQFREAEIAFERVVELDEECEDAVQELECVKLQQLLEIGFSEKHANAALQQYHSVQAAIDALSCNEVKHTSISGNLELENTDGDMCYSDEEQGSSSLSSPRRNQQLQSLKTNKMDPSNPEGHLSLWVGNVSQGMTEKHLVDLFSKFGVVLSVRLLPDKYCAFINFRDKTAPGPAMKSLQNQEIGGERLLIRYPNNPVPEAHQQIIVKKTTKCSGIGSVQAKVTGPVNGDECHFWRTTGCVFGSKCRYKHLKENKGVDRKPWQKAS